MISPETQVDVLAEISRNLARIADALESLNNAAIRSDTNIGSHIEVFATTHEA